MFCRRTASHRGRPLLLHIPHPVRVHPFFWLVMAILGLPRGDDLRQALVHLVTWILAAFLVFCSTNGSRPGHAGVRLCPVDRATTAWRYTSYNPTGSYRSAGYSTLVRS